MRDQAVAERIVAASGLAPPDTVYEVGAGGGELTCAIARVASRVIAVEQDRGLVGELRRRFVNNPGVEIRFADFLRMELPRSDPYKVIGNPPFAITSPLMRHLLGRANPPVQVALVMQREAALRWSGIARESVASLLAKVRYEFELCLALHRRDFRPFPRVDCVLLSVRPRTTQVIARRAEPAFERLVRLGFGGRHREVRKNLRGLVGHRTFQLVAGSLGIDPDARASELAFEDWLALFGAMTGAAGELVSP